MSENYKLTYNSAHHNRIRDALRSREELSHRKMTDEHKDWRQAEELALAYLPEKEMDAKRRVKREDGDPQYTTIEVPYSSATLLAGHTYWSSVFLGSRNPVFQYSGRHGEPEMSTQALTALIDYQVSVGRMLAPFYVWLYDTGRYGVGIIGNYWEKEEVTSSTIEEVPVTYMGVPLVGQTQKKKITRTTPGYVGNKVFNVRPFDFRPDPRTTINNVQGGEFCGRLVEAGWNSIVKGKHSGKYYQIDIAGKTTKTYKRDRGGSSQIVRPLEANEEPLFLPEDIGYLELFEVYVELIPKDWKLGQSDRPEVWKFTLANEEVIIESRPAGFYHTKFPFFTLTYEFENYARVPRGMMEILKPLNDALSWLFNSHMYNVRGSLNNNFIFDPSRVVAKDVMKDSPNKLIRLKESAYGTDVRSVITQLNTVDVTQGHLRDGQVVMDLMQRVVGITDNIQGQVNQGGRKTATEVRSSNAFGVNRQKTLTEWWSAGGFGELAQTLVQNTQQFYDISRQYKIAGDLMDWGQRGLVEVTPESIQGFYDFLPIDGTMPVDKFAQANLWREIFFGLRQMPEVAQQYDVAKIFEWMAQLAGLKNIREFKINVVPDEAAMMGADRGNLIPLRGETPERDLDRVPEPGQVGGMGTTG